MALQCNAISHWLGAYTECSLWVVCLVLADRLVSMSLGPWSWSSLGCLLDLSEVWEVPWWYSLYISGSVQDCNNSIASAMELLQSCAKPSSHVYRPTLDTGITLMALCKRGVTLFWIHLSCTPSASTKRCTCGIFHVSCTHSHCISLFLNINVKFSQLIWITSRSIIDQYNVSKHWCRWKLIINQTPNAALLTCWGHGGTLQYLLELKYCYMGSG